MRRLLAIAIAVLIVFPTISPAFALDNITRPTCCRRDGKHHCTLMQMGDPSAAAEDATQARVVTLSERCPYGPKSLPGSAHRHSALQMKDAIFAGIVAHPSVAPQTESRRRISADRSRQKRGPPTVARS